MAKPPPKPPMIIGPGIVRPPVVKPEPLTSEQGHRIIALLEQLVRQGRR